MHFTFGNRAGLALGFALSMAINLPASTLSDFSALDIDGKNKALSDYQGSVVIIVNTASRCGFTPQYDGLEALYKEFGAKGLVILGFPSNDFMGQEPGTEQEIKDFCSLKYNISFPLFSKIKVTGKDQHPLYKWLTSKDTNPQFAGRVSWNFNKFLIGRDGKVVGRFDSKVKPDSEEMRNAIKAALAASAPAVGS